MSQLAVLTDPAGAEAEAYRRLRASLLSKLAKGMVLVTSPGPDCGAESVAASLAVVLAEAERPTLALDADLRSAGGMGRLLGASGAPGLSEVLNGLAVASAIRETPVALLRVLPPGGELAQPGDKLASPAMAATVQATRTMADWIIVSAPPLLAASDGMTLASLADGVIVVVAAGRTRRDDAQRARDLVLSAGGTVLGSVVTGVELKEAGLAHSTESRTPETAQP